SGSHPVMHPHEVALARRIIYCQIIHEDKLRDQLAALCRPPSAFWRHFRQELKAFRVFAALVRHGLLVARASGKFNNIGRISPSFDLDQTAPGGSSDVLICASVLDFLVLDSSRSLYHCYSCSPPRWPTL